MHTLFFRPRLHKKRKDFPSLKRKIASVPGNATVIFHTFNPRDAHGLEDSQWTMTLSTGSTRHSRATSRDFSFSLVPQSPRRRQISRTLTRKHEWRFAVNQFRTRSGSTSEIEGLKHRGICFLQAKCYSEILFFKHSEIIWKIIYVYLPVCKTDVLFRNNLQKIILSSNVSH